MHRTIAFFAAILLSTIAVTSACVANSPDNIRFTLQSSTRSAGEVQLTLRSGNDRHNNVMTDRMAISRLSGLSPNWRAGGPVRFAIVREAGRIDCAGSSSAANRAEGACRFSENAAFSKLLASSGIGRPNREQAYGLTMVEARRDLVDALKAARYPMPSIDDYIAMTAVGVTPTYIRDLERAGYRPDRTKRLIEFAALKVTPAYLGALSRAGYANLPQDQVVQLAALQIDPEFIRGFERIGYRNLPVNKLVELKALGVTPEFVQSVRRSGMKNPTLDQVTKLKVIGFDPAARRR
jgi:hypothetical protein